MRKDSHAIYMQAPLLVGFDRLCVHTQQAETDKKNL